MIAKFKLDLPGSDWCVVITDTGNRFYHNNVTKESVWNYPNDKVGKLVHELNAKDQIIIKKIAEARGWNGGKFFDKKVIENQKLNSSKKIDIKKSEIINEKAVSSNTGVKRDKSIGVLSGYGESSDEDESDSSVYESESEDDQEKQEKEEEEEEEVYGLDLDELENMSDSESENEPDQDSNSKIKSLMSLFTINELNPFNAWETESQKINTHPQFLLFDTDKERREVFDDWCRIKLSNTNSINDTEEEKIEKLIDPDKIDFLHPIFEQDIDNPVLEYYDFLTKNFKLSRLYIDFKRKFKNTKFFNKDSELMEKDKEKVYLSFMNLKKKSITDRKQILLEFLSKSKIFKNCLINNNNYLKKVIEKFNVDFINLNKLIDLSIDEARILLKNLETLLKIPESILETHYYQAVPTKERIKVLVEVSEILLGRIK